MKSTDLMNYYEPDIAKFYQDLNRAGQKLVELLLRQIDGEAAEDLQEMDKMVFTGREK